MNAWWDSLSEVLKVLYCIAIPSTLVLVLQTVLIVFSFGDGGAGVNPSDTSGLDMGLEGGGDFSPEGIDLADGMEALEGTDNAGGVSSDFGTLRLFTFQGIIAFVATGSWVSICFVKGGMQIIPSLLIGGLCGVAVMYMVAKLMQFSSRLTENGTFHLRTTIGETAQVYVMIPPAGEQGGKVTLTMSSGFVEADAITDAKEGIPAGTMVRITDLMGDVVVVERLEHEE